MTDIERYEPQEGQLAAAGDVDSWVDVLAPVGDLAAKIAGKEGVAVLRQLPFPDPGDAEHGLAAGRLSRRHFPQGTVMEHHIRRHLRGFRQPAAFRAQELEQRIIHIHVL